MSPDGGAMSPDGGAMSPDGGAMSPDGGAMSPGRVEGRGPERRRSGGAYPHGPDRLDGPGPRVADSGMAAGVSRVPAVGTGRGRKIAPGAATCRGGRVRCSGMVPLDWNWPLRSRRLSLPSVAGRHCVA